jgi:hypothetical protein
MSLCESCRWNSKNGSVAALFDESRCTWVQVCGKLMPAYPMAKSCMEYEPLDRADGG